MKKNGQKAKSAWCKKAVEAIQKNYRSVLVILGFFLLWEFSVVWFKVPEFVLPPPSAALKHLFIKQADANYNWPLHIRTTLQEFILGFCVTAVLGIGLAIIFVWSKKVKDMVLPLFTFINSLPIIAIAPLILLWMGYGIKTNILIAFLVSFFPVVINTMTGLDSIEDDLLDLIRYLNASKLQLFIKIRIPNSLPYIFSGLKICSTMSIVGAIVGEFIASDRGLGYIIISAQYTMSTPPIFSSLIVISLAGAGLYWVVALAERLIMPWAFKKEQKG
ncbi:MAG: putative aliphatic sulfonates transport permease protein SsuC [Spirochaetes bacterium ADurb.Bin315]|jgi:NitT/TauT family transport system permease protein|nr:ABC transporter permease [Spirochaetota bacterium]OQA42939.1 MAG: putative aliphatic sulfonates transport permease protein SsuC [Spirochaetes bacterium ADurb.Bin315]HOE89910.1 ABC transporter permease [Sphaerochaeta sp.]HPK64533.1 ABC transporter permease [Sphaerochaeta sp.]